MYLKWIMKKIYYKVIFNGTQNYLQQEMRKLGHELDIKNKFDITMNKLNQLLLGFDFEQNFKNLDFYVSKSNIHVYDLIDNWKIKSQRFLNIVGDKFSGKTHLINIFLEKNRGLKFSSYDLDDHLLKKTKIYENVILEDLTFNTNEELLYSLINTMESENKKFNYYFKNSDF